MAQLVAHLVWDQGVARSSRVIPTNFYNHMAYVVLKHGEYMGKRTTIIVNDSEGEPIEFQTEEEALSIAQLFQDNTTHGSIYEVKFIGDGPSA